MTIPRELGLRQEGSEIYLTSKPAAELAGLAKGAVTIQNVAVKNTVDLTTRLKATADKHKLTLKTAQLGSFELVLGNAAGEELVIGYDQAKKQYFIDRSKAGQVGFSAKFASRATAPRLSPAAGTELTLYFDAASVELFADQGLTAMTEIFFASKPLTTVKLRSAQGVTFQEISNTPLAPKATGKPTVVGQR
jgi:fructan beta-fructosidase